jgi:glycerol-3-phosphate acyltransferase PlsY
MITVLVAAFVQAYFLGSIPFGLLAGRLRGLDIRKVGSGNIGATNVWRTLGWQWGLPTFLCDFGKGLVAVVIARHLADAWIPNAAPDDLNYAGISAAIACILGHSFPIWLGFKGGKGVATSLGVIIGMMPLAGISIFGIWGLVLWISRYVSVASIIAAFSLPIFVIGYLFAGYMHGWATFYFSVAAALLVILRHRANIRRLLAGTESRIGARKAAAEAAPEAGAPDSSENE